jgi:hypothetical protein
MSPLVQRSDGITDRLLWAEFENIRITHKHMDMHSAVQTPAVNRDFSAREKMAHGQRFQPSLAIPFLNPVHTYLVMVGQVGEGCP